MKTEIPKSFSRLYFIAPFILQSTVWRILMRPFFYLFSSFKVYGLENLNSITGPIIFAPNHSHEVDAVLLPLALPFWSKFNPIFYVVRESKFYTDPFFKWRKFIYGGWIFKLLGAYPLQSGIKNYAESLKSHIEILKSGGSVCIFPEGGFSKTGEIGAAHGGVGYLAFSTNAIVVPVLIKGTYNLSPKLFFMHKRKIEVYFLEPLKMNDLFIIDEPTNDAESMRGAAGVILDRIKQKQYLVSV